MAISDTILTLAPFIDTGFMITSASIIVVFLSRLNTSISRKQPNILGLILMGLGLSFHILGNLLRPLLVDSEFAHALFAFISFSVAMFIIGSALIAYHISSDENKKIVKIFSYIYSFFGLANILFHLSFYFAAEDWTNNIFGLAPSTLDFSYILLEAVSLTIIYILLLIQSRKSVRKAVSERFLLLSLTSLGFVLVLFVDAAISLKLVSVSGISVYSILFALHVLTVGTLYLLVFFPTRYQSFRGITSIN